MRGGNFPLAHHYPKALRGTRDLLRRRMHLTRYTSQLKAHVTNSTAQYNLAHDNGDLRYPGNREVMRHKFPDASLQCNIDMDLNLIEFHVQELKRVELHVKQVIKRTQLKDLHILKSIQGIGDIIGSTILLEIGDIQRFPTVKQFSSYSRLVKCKAESAGKTYGTQGNKIGNAHLKWAFSEAAVLYLRNSDVAKAYLAKLEKRMPKSKALSVLAHKLGRCVYFMLKNQQVFDEEQFMKS